MIRDACSCNRVLLMPFFKEVLSLEDDNWWHIAAIGTNCCHHCNHFLAPTLLHLMLLTLALPNSAMLHPPAKRITTLIKAIDIVWGEVILFQHFFK